jgi:preprotein translocase subunit SecY
LPDLRKKILFTLLILVIYRMAAHVPVPGVNLEGAPKVFKQNQLLGFVEHVLGWGHVQLSVMAMGFIPLSRTDLCCSFCSEHPAAGAVGQRGEAGRQKLNLYTHLLTIPLAACRVSRRRCLLHKANTSAGGDRELGFGAETLLPTIATLLTLSAGTLFAIWLGID